MAQHVRPLDRLWDVLDADEWKTRLADHEREPFAQRYDELFTAVLAEDSEEDFRATAERLVWSDAATSRVPRGELRTLGGASQ